MTRATPSDRFTRRAAIAAASAAGLAAPALWAQAAPGERNADFEIRDGRADWRILVSPPKVPPPPQGYGLILALDGAKLQPLLRDRRDAVAPDAPLIAAGITYPGAGRRWLDLTSPAKVLINPPPGTWRAPEDRQTGGRGAFLAMIATRLMPRLRQDYPLDDRRSALFGHSLGGLFVFHALFNEPTLFARYIAADPSTWWNAGEVVSEARAFAGGVRGAGGQLRPTRGLMLMRARGMAQGGKVGPVMIDTALTSALSRIGGLRLDYRLMPEETHGSVLAPAVAQAIDWQLSGPQK